MVDIDRYPRVMKDAEVLSNSGQMLERRLCKL
jgi:hypothetical protein